MKPEHKNISKLIYIIMAVLLGNVPAYSQKTVTLEESRMLALKNNTVIQNSRLELEASRKVKGATFTNYFPKVSAGATAFQANDSLFSMHLDLPPAFVGMIPDTFGMFKYGDVEYINVAQPLYAGGRIYNGNKLASLGLDVSLLKMIMVRKEVLISTEEQYWQNVSLSEKMRTVIKYEELLGSLLRQVEAAHAAGLVMKTDVLKVRQKVSEVRLNKSKLENGRKLASMAFCQYIGIPAEDSLVFSDTLDVTGRPEEIRVNHSEYVRMRLEYKLLEKSNEAVRLQSKMKMGEYLPVISAGVSGMRMSFDGVKGTYNGVVYGMARVPISEWWGGFYELKERDLKERINENDVREKTELLMLQMEKAWQDLTASCQQIALCEKSREEAAENVKVNDDGFKNGVTDVSDFLEAQALLLDAENQLVEARAQYRINTIKYLQVTGRDF